jgi:hypothetical protein
VSISWTVPAPQSPATTLLLAGSDGGVYAFGDAPFEGSLPGLKVTPARPVVGIAPTTDGKGYWMGGADGGVYAFGDATFPGALSGSPLSSPVSAVG